MIKGYNWWLRKMVLIVAILSLNGVASAQFLHMELDIDNEVAAGSDQKLNFGTLPVGSGRHKIQFGDANMGILRISTIENQTLILFAQKPNALTSTDDNSHRIPIEIGMRYGYNKKRPGNSLQLAKNNTIHIEEDSSEGIWRNLYIFMYGTIEIGAVPSGVYYNKLTINVEYI